MTMYYICPWCNKEDDDEISYIPAETYCALCNGKITIGILKGWEEEENDVQKKT